MADVSLYFGVGDFSRDIVNYYVDRVEKTGDNISVQAMHRDEAGIHLNRFINDRRSLRIDSVSNRRRFVKKMKQFYEEYIYSKWTLYELV